MLTEKDYEYIWNHYFDEYVSLEFLGRLEANSTGLEPFKTRNANGILFLGMMIFLFQEHSKYSPFLQRKLSELKDKIDACLKRLQVPGHPGHFVRSADNNEMEKHDNYNAIVLLSVMFDLPYHKDILEAGRYKFKFNKYLGFDSYFNYNTHNPGQFRWDTQRQGGEIGFYKMANGKSAGLLYLLWSVVGFWIAGIKKYPSSMNLGWFRFMVGMPMIFKKHKFSFITKGIVKIAIKVYMKILEKKGIDVQYGFDNYFRSEHPIHLLTRPLYKKQ